MVTPVLLPLQFHQASLTGNTSVIEGGNVNLNYSATGNPKPRITWTRLSDNSVVTMPLTNKHDAGDHRCTSENVVGTHSTIGVTIDVRCKYYVESTSESSDQMISLFSSL